jgi:hypothetical protein
MQNKKIYYTENSKLYCENLKTGKKKAICKVPKNAMVEGMVGKYIVIQALKCKEKGNKQNWTRTVILYDTSGKKVKTVYSKTSTYIKQDI